jgi:hypothetical protein
MAGTFIQNQFMFPPQVFEASPLHTRVSRRTSPGLSAG